MPETETLLRQVLRVGREPYGYFDEWAVHRLLTESPLEYLRFVKDELGEIASGRAHLELPPKQIFPDPGEPSDFRVMPCVVRGRNGARKTVKLVGTNTRQECVPNQITVGKAFVVDPAENFVSQVFEACLLSSARTGACAAIGLDLLAPSRGKLGVVGAGRVGYYAALYAAAQGGIESVTFWDRDRERARQAAALLTRQLPTVRFVAASQSDELADVEVMVLATTSTFPVCDPDKVGAGLVVSLGADTDYQSELDPAWAAVADIFVDTRDCLRFGDLRAWRRAGLLRGDAPLDLFDLLRMGGPPASGRRRAFISTGSALFDNLTIGYLLQRADKGPVKH